MKSAVPTTTIHPNGFRSKLPKPFVLQVFTRIHSSDDAGECHEFLLLAAQ